MPTSMLCGNPYVYDPLINIDIFPFLFYFNKENINSHFLKKVTTFVFFRGTNERNYP